MPFRKLVLAVLVLALLQTGGAAFSQELNDGQKRVLALIREWAAASDSNQWWDQNAGRVTREIVDQAEDLGTDAIRHNAARDAKAIYSFAALGYLRLGDRPKALNSMLNVNEVNFNIADTPEQYRDVRSSALNLMKMANESHVAPDIQFRLALLAADCTFFSGRPENNTSTDEKWLQSMLIDLVPVFEKSPANTSEPERERFASLSADALGLAVSQYFSNEEQITAELKKIAGSLDAAFPADFAYRTAVGDAHKSLITAQTFAQVSYRFGDPAAASARLAIAATNARAAGDLDNYLTIIYERYRGERQTRQSPAQLRQLRSDARAVVGDIRKRYHSRAGRIWNAFEMDSAYGEMLRDELRDEAEEPPEQVFAAVEMLKARLLLDDLLAPPGQARPSVPAERIAALEKSILGFPPDDVSKDDLYMTETKLISRLSSFSPLDSSGDRSRPLAEVEKLFAQGGYSSVAAPTTLADVQRSLEPSEAILEYVIPYNELHPASDLGILWITRDRVERVHLDLEKLLPSSGVTGSIAIDGKARVDFSPLGEGVVSTRTAIRSSNEKEAKAKLQGFYQLLIGPLLSKGFKPEAYSRLIVVPHGVLQYLPFAALLDENGKPLIAKSAITMAPSAAVWRQLLNRNAPVHSWVAYGNPALGAGLEPLENSQREVEAIAPQLKGVTTTVRLTENASIDRFVQEAPSAGILHVATHGAFPDENALDEHALLLAPGARGEGVLRAREIRGLKLAETRLVVLSVCNGALYRMGPTDEPYGLVPAFLEAGAQNVAGTLWPVDDAFGRRFMVEFYQHLMKDGPAEALRQTALHFIGEDELIRRWAGFVVSGPGRPF